jgi:hypothetical protein
LFLVPVNVATQHKIRGVCFSSTKARVQLCRKRYLAAWRSSPDDPLGKPAADNGLGDCFAPGGQKRNSTYTGLRLQTLPIKPNGNIARLMARVHANA